MTFLPAKRAHWIIPISPMSLVPWVSSGALFLSAKGKLSSVYNFLTSISFALNKLGTHHNSPPVSKCKRVNSQGLGQTGTGWIMPGFIQGQLLLPLTPRSFPYRSWGWAGPACDKPRGSLQPLPESPQVQQPWDKALSDGAKVTMKCFCPCLCCLFWTTVLAKVDSQTRPHWNWHLGCS